MGVPDMNLVRSTKPVQTRQQFHALFCSRRRRLCWPAFRSVKKHLVSVTLDVNWIA